MILFHNRFDVVVNVFQFLSVSVGLVNNNNKNIQIIQVKQYFKNEKRESSNVKR